MIRWRGGPDGHEDGQLLPESTPGTTDDLGWRPACACGWTGPRRHRRHLAQPPSESVQILALAEWQAHLRGLRHLAKLNELLDEREAMERRHRAALEENTDQLETVVQALRQVATWQEIGDELGVTRQAAHNRLSRYLRRR